MSPPEREREREDRVERRGRRGAFRSASRPLLRQAQERATKGVRPSRELVVCVCVCVCVCGRPRLGVSKRGENAMQGNARQGNAMQGKAMQCSAVQCNATQRNATQRSAAQRNATQRSAAQRSATHSARPSGPSIGTGSMPKLVASYGLAAMSSRRDSDVLVVQRGIRMCHVISRAYLAATSSRRASSAS